MKERTFSSFWKPGRAGQMNSQTEQLEWENEPRESEKCG